MASQPVASSSDVARRFAYYCDEALLHPVTIERHGEPRIVMLSLREYQRLALLDHKSYSAEEMPDEHLAALDASAAELAA